MFFRAVVVLSFAFKVCFVADFDLNTFYSDVASVCSTPVLRAGLAALVGSDNPLLRTYAFDSSPEVRQVVATRPDCPPPLLVSLANDVVSDVVVAVCANPATPPEVLSQLLDRFFVGSDKHLNIYAVALLCKNPSLPPSEVQRLLQQGDDNVRISLAHRPGLDVGLQLLLAADESEQVRFTLASNSSTVWQVLSQLVSDSDPEVAEAVLLSSDVSPELLLAVASNDFSAFDPELIKDESFTDRLLSAAARSRGLTSAAAVALAKSLSVDVRSYLGYNPKTPRLVLQKLSDDPVDEVRYAALSNANLSAEFLDTVFAEDPDDVASVYNIALNPNISSSLLSTLVNYPDVDVRTATSSSSDLTEDMMVKLLNDEEENVAIDVLHHPNLTSLVWQRLSEGKRKSLITWVMYSPVLLPDFVGYRLRAIPSSTDGADGFRRVLDSVVPFLSTDHVDVGGLSVLCFELIEGFKGLDSLGRGITAGVDPDGLDVSATYIALQTVCKVLFKYTYRKLMSVDGLTAADKVVLSRAAAEVGFDVSAVSRPSVSLPVFNKKPSSRSSSIVFKN